MIFRKQSRAALGEFSVKNYVAEKNINAISPGRSFFEKKRNVTYSKFDRGVVVLSRRTKCASFTLFEDTPGRHKLLCIGNLRATLVCARVKNAFGRLGAECKGSNLH